MKKDNNLVKQVAIVILTALIMSSMLQSVVFADETREVGVVENTVETVDSFIGTTNTNDVEENINLIDIMEQTKETGFSIIEMYEVEYKDDKLHLLERADFTTIEFNEEISINNGTEDLKLRSLILNIVEGEIVPIYNSKVNYIEALLRKMIKEGYTALEMKEKYQLRFDASSVLFGDNSPTESVLKRDVSDLIYIDYMDGVDVETLKQEYGVNDDYIRFVIEPKAIYNHIVMTVD